MFLERVRAHVEVQVHPVLAGLRLRHLLEEHPAAAVWRPAGRSRAATDGFRSIVFRDGDEVEIGSRNEKPMTRYFPELVEAVKHNLPTRCVVDGET